jgi:recombinational DNA repair ATPase RecF
MSYHQLKSVNVKGYKSIKDQEIPLTKINVLIGQNGAGKTNFISLTAYPLRSFFVITISLYVAA